MASKLRSPILSWQTSAPPRIPELCRRDRIPSERWTVRLRSPILSWPANCAHRSCRGRHLHRQGSLYFDKLSNRSSIGSLYFDKLSNRNSIGSLSCVEGAADLLKDGRFDCAHRSCRGQQTALTDPVMVSKLRSPILSWQTSAPPGIPVLRQVQQPQQHRIPELCRRGRIPSESWTVRLRSPILSWQTSAPPRIPVLRQAQQPQQHRIPVFRQAQQPQQHRIPE